MSAALGAVLILAAALYYVTAPPRGEDAYRERAASSAETLRSQVQLTRIWVESVEDGESTETAGLVGISEAERAALHAASKFEAYEPPSGLDGLRSEFSSLAGEASDALAALRIAGQQGEWDLLPELSEPLPGLAGRLEEFEEEAEP